MPTRVDTFLLENLKSLDCEIKLVAAKTARTAAGSFIMEQSST